MDLSEKINSKIEEILKNESFFGIDTVQKIKKPKRKILIDQEYNSPSNVDDIKNRIMIDFDGVIYDYDGWNDGKLINGPIPVAIELIKDLKNDGFEIVIFTSRASENGNQNPTSEELINDMKIWLKKYDIPYDYITSEKLPALVYIDDRALNFTKNLNIRNIKQKIKTLLNKGI